MFSLIDGPEEAKSNDPTTATLQEVVDGLKSIRSEQEFLMRREIEHKEGMSTLTFSCSPH